MNQTVIYKGILVDPVERSGDKILVSTKNLGDAQRAGLPFKELREGAAYFEGWVPEKDLVPVNS